MYGIGIYRRRHRALCSDGKWRMAQQTGEPDTFFSMPARVQVNGKTVSGFLTTRTVEVWDNKFEPIWVFIAYSYRKNAALLPGTVK